MSTKRAVIQRKSAYHHGNLKAALIDAGLSMLRLEGPGEVSLRACARLVGVTQAAPAYHFKTKNGLLVAIAGVGFQRLTAAMVDKTAAESDPGRKLLAVMKAYLEFASSEPALFDLMFTKSTFAEATPELENIANASFEMLALTLSEHEHHMGGPKSEPGIAAFTAWATVHGLTSLLLAAPIPPRYGKGGDSKKMGDATLEFLCKLLASAPPLAERS